MRIKLIRVVSKGEGSPPIEGRDPSIASLHVLTWQMKNEISQLSRDLWPPNLTGWWLMTRCRAATQKAAWNFHYVFSRGHVANKTQHISTSTLTAIIRLDRIVAYDKGSSPKESCDICSRVFKLQIKKYTFKRPITTKLDKF